MFVYKSGSIAPSHENWQKQKDSLWDERGSDSTPSSPSTNRADQWWSMPMILYSDIFAKMNIHFPSIFGDQMGPGHPNYHQICHMKRIQRRFGLEHHLIWQTQQQRRIAARQGGQGPADVREVPAAEFAQLLRGAMGQGAPQKVLLSALKPWET